MLTDLINLGFTPITAILLVAVIFLYNNSSKAVAKVVAAKELAEVNAKKELAELELKISKDREAWHTETRAELHEMKTRSDICEKDRIAMKGDIRVLTLQQERVSKCPIADCPSKP